MFTRLKKWIKEKWRKIVVWFIVPVAMAAGVTGVVLDDNIPEYKLKVDKSLIIGQKQKGDTVKYAYKSNKKIVDDVLEIKEKRTKSSRTFKTENKNEFRAEFIAGVPQYYEDKSGKWWIADYATTTKVHFDTQTKPTVIENLLSYFNKNALAATDTFYPDVNPETSSVDGWTFGLDASWDTLHDAETSYLSNDDNETNVVSAGLGTTSSYSIFRSILLFDTSSIGAGFIVTDATLSIYVYNTNNAENDGSDFIAVVSSNPASNASITTADYDQVGDSIDNPTEGSNRIDITSMSIDAYTDFTLDTDGIGWIDMEGITKLGFREGHDILDDIPTVSGNSNAMYFQAAETTGTSEDPKLVVTYILDSTCTYTSGDWIVNYSDDCEISSDVWIDSGSELHIIRDGAGSFQVTNGANISTAGAVFLQSPENIIINDTSNGLIFKK